jgi:hypothetical protein
VNAIATAPVVGAPAENPWHNAQRQFDQAAKLTHLESGLCAVLREVKRQLIVSFPVKMDDGSVRVFEGYRVQHNMARGPAKGGIRYHQGVTLDEVKSTGDVDDKEVRHRWAAVRRRQGRHRRRPQTSE